MWCDDPNATLKTPPEHYLATSRVKAKLWGVGSAGRKFMIVISAHDESLEAPLVQTPRDS